MSQASARRYTASVLTTLHAFLSNHALPTIRRGVAFEAMPGLLLESPDSLTAEQRSELDRFRSALVVAYAAEQTYERDGVDRAGLAKRLGLTHDQVSDILRRNQSWLQP